MAVIKILRGNNIGVRLLRRILRLRKTAIIRRIVPFRGGIKIVYSPKAKNSPTAGQTTGTVTTIQQPDPPVVQLVPDVAPPTQTPADATTISETTLMFMRAKTIVFNVTGLKPNTTYYPFFNGVYVGAFCTTQGTADAPISLEADGTVPTDSRTITSNEFGSITGLFFLPGGQFTTGSHTFQLVDHTDDDAAPTKPDPLFGLAEAAYEANGTLKQMESQVTATSPVDNTAPSAPVTVPPPKDPIIYPPSPTGCQEWYFEYRIITTQAQKTFINTTDSITPPSIPSKNTGGGMVERALEALTVTYVGTTINQKGRYEHKYSYTEINVTSVRRQRWRGPALTDSSQIATTLPALTMFAPTGLRANQRVEIMKQWTLQGKCACPRKAGFYTPPPRPHDPLAQSFWVDGEVYPNGMYVTSIEVFFKTVDQSTPVSLEMRNMINGYPGPSILPNGEVMLPGNAASQSSDASQGTVFRFDAPVFLLPQNEYCFVVKSTSLGYNAWCSQLGDADVTTGKIIDVNPFLGTLFKSENNNTWIADSFQDMKFNINAAVFDANAGTEMIFRPKYNPDTNNYYATVQNLPLSYMRTTFGSNTVSVNIPLHGLKSGDKIYIEGIDTPIPVSAYNGFTASDLMGEFTVTRLDDDNVSFNVTTGAVATRTSALITADTGRIMDLTPATMPVTQTLTSAAPVTNGDTFSPATSPAGLPAVNVPASPAFVSNNSFRVYSNLIINEVMIDYVGSELPGTTIVEKIKIATGVGIDDAPDAPAAYVGKPEIEINRDGFYHELTDVRALATPRNEALGINPQTLGGTGSNAGKSMYVRIGMETTDKNVSPIIDLNGISLVTRSYVIDNQNGEIDVLKANTSATIDDYNDPAQNSEINPGTGTAAAKYKSTVVQMEEYYKTLDIYIAANCPEPAQFDVYIRTSTDQSTHMDRSWKWVPVDGVLGTKFANSSDKYVMNEWNFVHRSDTTFNTYDLKIVMRTTNPSSVPKIYSIRTIAQDLV